MAKRVNENYIHNCGLDKQTIREHEKAITEMGFSQEHVIRILDFFSVPSTSRKRRKREETIWSEIAKRVWMGW